MPYHAQVSVTHNRIYLLNLLNFMHVGVRARSFRRLGGFDFGGDGDAKAD